MSIVQKIQNHLYPDLPTSIELIKPITWFPPMWAFLCGAVSTGSISLNDIPMIALGVFLAGPMVCGMSQAANDWCDRHVDAINEPHRPIPSGRMPVKWGLGIAIAMSIMSLIVGWFLSFWGFVATAIAVICAWAYSAEPIRLKKSGIWGPFLVGLCYEGLPWFTGAAILSIGFPRSDTVMLAVLYAIGAYGIMTLNDFKAITGDRRMGVKSLPVLIGETTAARLACTVMLLPQMIVIYLLFDWNLSNYGLIIIVALVLQILAMARLVRNPVKFTPWFNRTGVTFYVIGMMVSAVAVSSGIS